MARQEPHTREETRHGPAGPALTHGDVRERLIASLPITEKRVELDGIPTAVLEGGRGTPVILLHGPGGYGAQWLRVIPRLVESHHVIAPDLPGHGASGVGEGQLDSDRILGWLEDLIECTCTSRPVLVGHVLGGAIAACYAAGRRDRLSALVLVDSLGLAAFQPEPEFGGALQDFMSHPDEDTHDRLWAVCSHDLDALRAGLLESWQWMKAYNLACAQAPAQAHAVGHLMQTFGLPEIPPAALERISVPTSLIWGRHDRATPLRVAEAASSRYSWPLHVVDDAADDPSLDQPDAFLDELRVAIDRSR